MLYLETTSTGGKQRVPLATTKVLLDVRISEDGLLTEQEYQ